MTLFTAVVIFILVWWVTLFTVLPLGVRGQAEDGNITRGTEPGAPVDSQMKRKVILTTIISLIAWAIICGVIISGVIDLKNYSFYTGE